MSFVKRRNRKSDDIILAKCLVEAGTLNWIKSEQKNRADSVPRHAVSSCHCDLSNGKSLALKKICDPQRAEGE